MGKRGPKPTPTEKLKLGGSWRGYSRKNEPTPDNKRVPDCPDWLTGEARNTWFRIAPELRSINCLSYIDGNAFARYCIYHVLWLKELSNPGRTEATLERYANQLNRLEMSFGLTPSARTGLETNKAEDKDEFAELEKPKIG